jgi:hypothetical protein
MNLRQYNLLLHPLFLFNLVLLSLNDFIFKCEFHNWLTGKLSDFSGLFVFAVFFISFFPSSRKRIVLLVALFFCWWKSSWSEPLIAFVNTTLQIPINRVVDYTDIYALIVLPLALHLRPVEYRKTVLRQFLAGIIAFIAFTAFTATSLPRMLADNNRVKLDKHIRTRNDEGTIIQKLEDQGLHPVPDTIYEKNWDSNYYLKSKDSAGRMIPVNSLYSGVYTKIEYGSSYVIPKMYVAGDSISNLQFVITPYNPKKNQIWLHSFEYNPDKKDNTYSNSYYTWKRFRKPIKKKMKEIVGK